MKTRTKRLPLTKDLVLHHITFYSCIYFNKEVKDNSCIS